MASNRRKRFRKRPVVVEALQYLPGETCKEWSVIDAGRPCAFCDNRKTVPVMHLVPAGRPIGTTACGLPTETPDRPWHAGLVPDEDWAGPFARITCPDCLATNERGYFREIAAADVRLLLSHGLVVEDA